MRKTLITMLTAISIVGCVSHPKQTGPETVLAQMRADTAWIRTLDSLAAIAIGPGVKCIDPVWHLFSWEGRNFFHNDVIGDAVDGHTIVFHNDLPNLSDF